MHAPGESAPLSMLAHLAKGHGEVARLDRLDVEDGETRCIGDCASHIQRDETDLPRSVTSSPYARGKLAFSQIVAWLDRVEQGRLAGARRAGKHGRLACERRREFWNAEPRAGARQDRPVAHAGVRIGQAFAFARACQIGFGEADHSVQTRMLHQHKQPVQQVQIRFGLGNRHHHDGLIHVGHLRTGQIRHPGQDLFQHAVLAARSAGYANTIAHGHPAFAFSHVASGGTAHSVAPRIHQHPADPACQPHHNASIIHRRLSPDVHLPIPLSSRARIPPLRGLCCRPGCGSGGRS